MTLHEIDPERVADQVVREVLQHLTLAAMRLEPAWQPHLPEAAGWLGLRTTARALASFARQGLPAWDWADADAAAEGLREVLWALYGAPRGSVPREPSRVVGDADPWDEVGLVLLAAGARIQLSRGLPVAAPALGALTGLGALRTRALIAAGELPAANGDPERARAEEARRWLATRAVPGFR